MTTRENQKPIPVANVSNRLDYVKEPQYLYVYIGENDGYIFSRFHPSKYSNPECIGKIKLEELN